MDGFLSRRRGQRGAVLVEFVFVLPLLFALLLGITTAGLAYATKISVIEAVREGARFGASYNLSTAPSAITDFEAAVKSRVVNSSGGTLSASDVCVKLALPVGGNDCGVLDPVSASAEPKVHLVKVGATKQAKIQFFFFTTTATLNQHLAARYERDLG